MKGSLRLRTRQGRRERVLVTGCASTEEYAARCALIRRVADELADGGRPDRVKDICVQLGAATTPRLCALIVRSVKELLSRDERPPEDVLFRDHASDWTSGELHKRWPDYVKKKDSADDKSKLRLYILPIVGDVPLVVFSLLHAEKVMRKLPPSFEGATRRHVAQIMYRLLRMAVYPCRIIGVNPLPVGFLPKIPKDKAKQYLYPDEEARLLACTAVPLAYRLTYGVLAREGLRRGELLGNPKKGTTPLAWSDFDLERGMLRLDRNKTDNPRAWVLDAGVARALAEWKKRSPAAPFPDVEVNHFANGFREHLALAGVVRPELTERSATRRRIVGHDLRATFITLALANGKSEGWIQDRTGHTSSAMLNRYRRLARQFSELNLGQLGALDALIPEFSIGGWATGGPRGSVEGQGAA